MFLGRFLLGLRTWASWLAGATRMRWRVFAFYNALGGVTWACGVGLIAFYLGHSAENALSVFGVFGLVAVAVAVTGLYLAHRMHKRRMAAEASAASASHDAQANSNRPAREAAPTAGAGAPGELAPPHA